jgi:16S rRNA processing protein RimM
VGAESFIPVTLARILRPWGRRGEVAAELLTDFPQRLTERRTVWLSSENGAPRPVEVVSCRLHLGQAIFHFQGINTISEAETLRGAEVQIPVAERAPAGEGRYYVTDLIGCAIWDSDTAQLLGTVEDVQRAGEEPLGGMPEAAILVVLTPAGELLIPLAAEICTKIDTAARRIEVRLPEGLRELNAS